jgi:hypothetical protein
MPVIVVSYRRADSREITRRIYDQLVARYGTRSVYMDIESIQPSADYRVHIRQTLERALVMLAVIGPQWSGPRPDARSRIFDPDDPVRVEVETALANRRAVMPLLVDGAVMPTEEAVPPSLASFHYLHAVAVRAGDEFASDIARLCGAIDRLAFEFRALYASLYLLLPIGLMLLAQYLILFKLDTDPLYLRATAGAIAALVGIGLCVHLGVRTSTALLTGTAVGLASAVAMLTVNTVLGNPGLPFAMREILPSVTRDWQEVVEYVGIVAGVTSAANAAGWMLLDRSKKSLT